MDMPAGFTEPVIAPGKDPLAGLTVSHGPPEVEAEYDADVPARVSASFCDGGVVPPL